MQSNNFLCDKFCRFSYCYFWVAKFIVTILGVYSQSHSLSFVYSCIWQFSADQLQNQLRKCSILSKRLRETKALLAAFQRSLYFLDKSSRRQSICWSVYKCKAKSIFDRVYCTFFLFSCIQLRGHYGVSLKVLSTVRYVWICKKHFFYKKDLHATSSQDVWYLNLN